MLAECRTGPIISAEGAVNPARTSKTGALVTLDAHGRYQEAVVRGNVFLAANTATQALSLNSGTATGLILTNPAGSTKNLILLEVCVALASLPAGQSNLILTGNNNPAAAIVTHTTPLTVRNALMGSGLGAVGLADSAATIPNANIMRIIGGGTAATVATSTAFPPFIRDEIAGLIVLAPGTCISLQCLTTAITVVASMAWEEVSL